MNFSYNEPHVRREDATESNIDVQLNVTILNIDRIDTVSILTGTKFRVANCAIFLINLPLIRNLFPFIIGEHDVCLNHDC